MKVKALRTFPYVDISGQAINIEAGSEVDIHFRTPKDVDFLVAIGNIEVVKDQGDASKPEEKVKLKFDTAKGKRVMKKKGKK